MHAMNFDTLEYLNELKRAGMNEDEAQALTKATAKAFAQVLDLKEVATKTDFKQLEAVLRKDMADNKLELMKYVSDTKIELIKYTHDTMWKMIGAMAGIMTLFGIAQHYFK